MKVLDHYKTNFRIAAPVMIGQLGHIMVSVADSIMVGQLGTIPLAAVALGNSIFGMFMVFGLGMSFGVTPLVAKADGQNREHLPGVLLRHAFWVNLVVGFVIFAVLAAATPLLFYLDQDAGVAEMASPYLVIVSASVIPLLVFMTFKQFAEGLADTRMAMVISVACNLINVGLNYVLIYGLFGLPAMGLNGAGWATLIARIIMAAIMWYYVVRAKRFKRFGLKVGLVSFRQKITRRLLQIGIPSGLQFTFEVGAFSLAAVFAGMLSATALAAHQIAISIASVSYMAVTGLGAAATVRIGNQAGKGDANALQTAARTLFSMAVVWMVFSGLLIYFGRGALASFYSDDVAVLALAGQMLIVVVIFQLSDGLQAVGLGALRGFTDVKIPTLISFSAYWILTLPLAYGLSQYTAFGALGIWYALAFGLTLSAVLLLWRFKRLVAAFSR